MIYLEPREIYDKAIKRIESVVIYDFEMIIELVMNNLDCSYLEAVDWFCYNMESAQKPGWPIFEELEDSEE